MLRAIRSFFLFIMAAFLVILLISNRHAVMLSVDPFDLTQSELTYSAPLYLVVFVVFLLGILFGWFAAWRSQRQIRKANRDNRYESAKWRHRAEQYHEENEHMAEEIVRLKKEQKTLPKTQKRDLVLMP